jgi:hypothetical protein
VAGCHGFQSALKRKASHLPVFKPWRMIKLGL